MRLKAKKHLESKSFAAFIESESRREIKKGRILSWFINIWRRHQRMFDFAHRLMFTQIVHLLPVLVSISRVSGSRLAKYSCYLSHMIAPIKKGKIGLRDENLFCCLPCCFDVNYCHPHDKCRARKKCLHFFFCLPSQKARDKHTKSGIFKRRLFCHKLSSSASGHKKIVQHTFLHRFLCRSRHGCSAMPLRKCENIRRWIRQ